MFIFVLALFLSAWVNRGEVTIDITALGEHYIELALFVIVTPLMALGFHYYVVASDES